MKQFTACRESQIGGDREVSLYSVAECGTATVLPVIAHHFDRNGIIVNNESVFYK
jgi:hypothetical protein